MARSTELKLLPFAPVERHLLPHCPEWSVGGPSTVSALARRLHVARQTVYRWRAGVSPKVADRIATTLDLHPAILWPDYHPEMETTMPKYVALDTPTLMFPSVLLAVEAATDTGAEVFVAGTTAIAQTNDVAETLWVLRWSESGQLSYWWERLLRYYPDRTPLDGFR